MYSHEVINLILLFFLDLHDGGMSDKSDGNEDLEPDLLPGEHCIARAHRVISYSTVQG